jgi:uncharacterized cupin superfamily protein
MKSIVAFGVSQVGQEALIPAAERVLRGDPRQLVWNHYADPTAQFNAGTWQGEPGAWRVRYDPHEEEFCVLLEGEMMLTAADGQVQHFRAGDAFVVPGGFEGVWENRTRVRKHYAIMALKPHGS